MLDAFALAVEVCARPCVGAVVGEREGVADEARGARAAGDPGRQAGVHGQVEDLLGCHAHAGAGVGVVTDHRRVDGHRDPHGLFGVFVVAEPEQEPALEQVGHALADLLGVFGARAELREVLQAEGDVQAGGAVRGDLVDDVLGGGDVVGFVGDQRDARPFGFGEPDLALQLGVEHAQDEVHARLAVVGADGGHVGVDDQDVAGADDVAEGDVAGVVEEASQRRNAGEPADLVARGVEPLRGRARGELQVLWQFGAEELGRLVQVGRVGAGLVDRGAGVGLGWHQQAVDVLEAGAAVVFGGERDRADDRVVEVAARGLEDLVLVDVQQGGDHVVGDRGRFQRQRVGAGEAQRAHPERGVAEVQVPEPLGRVRRCEAQAQPAELALGVQDDHGGVLVAHVIQVGP